ncbi:IclR family transcriptional regulator [Ureibacillus sp. NPDC094379]
MTDKEKASNQTASRIFNIMEILSRNLDGMTLMNIVEELGKPPKSSIYVILKQMVNNRYVSYLEKEKIYKIGPALIRLSAVVMNEHTIQRHARFFLEEISKVTGEDSFLGILDGNRLQYIDKVEGTQSIRVNISIGATRYLHSSSIGKLLLANLSENEKKRIIEEEKLVPITKNTITDTTQLFNELSNIMKNGYSINNEESIEGVMGIAAPIRNNLNEVVAGICITLPVSRAVRNKESLIQLVKNTAEEISKQLAGSN